MFSFLLSRHRKKPVATEAQKQDFSKLSRKLGNTLLPKTMRFRELRMAHIDTVGVYRSPIHGRGLFSKRHIDEEQMIIEYTGHVVRSSLTDQREKYYESKVSPAFTHIVLGSCDVIRHVFLGHRLLHVPDRRRLRHRRDFVWFACALHQPLVRSQLLLQDRDGRRHQTHRHFRIERVSDHLQTTSITVCFNFWIIFVNLQHYSIK